MSVELRRKVLSCFKQLHRARQTVFEGDEVALAASRSKINTEFVKNKHVSNADAVEELVAYGKQIEEVLRKNVLQAVKVDDTTYRAEIRKDTAMLDNSPFSDMPVNMIGPFKRKKKCGDPETKGS